MSLDRSPPDFEQVIEITGFAPGKRLPSNTQIHQQFAPCGQILTVHHSITATNRHIFVVFSTRQAATDAVNVQGHSWNVRSLMNSAPDVKQDFEKAVTRSGYRNHGSRRSRSRGRSPMADEKMLDSARFATDEGWGPRQRSPSPHMMDRERDRGRRSPGARDNGPVRRTDIASVEDFRRTALPVGPSPDLPYPPTRGNTRSGDGLPLRSIIDQDRFGSSQDSAAPRRSYSDTYNGYGDVRARSPEPLVRDRRIADRSIAPARRLSSPHDAVRDRRREYAQDGRNGPQWDDRRRARSPEPTPLNGRRTSSYASASGPDYRIDIPPDVARPSYSTLPPSTSPYRRSSVSRMEDYRAPPPILPNSHRLDRLDDRLLDDPRVVVDRRLTDPYPLPPISRASRDPVEAYASSRDVYAPRYPPESFRASPPRSSTDLYQASIPGQTRYGTARLSNAPDAYDSDYRAAYVAPPVDRRMVIDPQDDYLAPRDGRRPEAFVRPPEPPVILDYKRPDDLGYYTAPSREIFLDRRDLDRGPDRDRNRSRDRSRDRDARDYRDRDARVSSSIPSDPVRYADSGRAAPRPLVSGRRDSLQDEHRSRPPGRPVHIPDERRLADLAKPLPRSGAADFRDRERARERERDKERLEREKIASRDRSRDLTRPIGRSRSRSRSRSRGRRDISPARRAALAERARNTITVFVSNLPPDVVHPTFLKMFSDAAGPDKLVDAQTGRAGFAFVHLKDKESADAVVSKLHHVEYSPKFRMNVSIGKSPHEYRKAKSDIRQKRKRLSESVGGVRRKERKRSRTTPDEGDGKDGTNSSTADAPGKGDSAGESASESGSNSDADGVEIENNLVYGQLTQEDIDTFMEEAVRQAGKQATETDNPTPGATDSAQSSGIPETVQSSETLTTTVISGGKV